MYQDLSNKKNGYSLIEVLISILFFTTIAVSLSAPLTESLTLTSNDQSIITATNLARRCFETVDEDWSTQQSFDTGELLDVTVDEFTNSGQFVMSLNSEDIEENIDDIVILRRLNVIITNKNNNDLIDLSYEINRPVSSFRLQ